MIKKRTWLKNSKAHSVFLMLAVISGFSLLASSASAGVYEPGLTERLALFTTLDRSVNEIIKFIDTDDPQRPNYSSIYYLGADGRRHAFPDISTYSSWNCDYPDSHVIRISDLSQIPIGKNITYRPGLHLVKFQSVSTVYLVQPGSLLRPIKDEATAQRLSGDNWNKQISEISEAFYTDYVIGEIIDLQNVTQLQSLNLSPTSSNMNLPG